MERGVFPPPDMGATHVPAPSGTTAAVLGFTGHVIVAADVAPAWLHRHLPAGDPGGAFNPPFLGALERRLDRRVNNIDVLLLAPGGARPAGPAGAGPEPSEVGDADHPRVRRARRYRDTMRVFTVPGGVLVLGRGLAGRREVAVEVDPRHRGRGLGRWLAAWAVAQAPGPLWAQVAPGNAASLRAFLAAGYLPVGQEALLVES